MAKWLKQASQRHEMCCHDLEIMNLNPCRVKLGALGTSVLSPTSIKIKYSLDHIVPADFSEKLRVREIQLCLPLRVYLHIKFHENQTRIF